MKRTFPVLKDAAEIFGASRRIVRERWPYLTKLLLAGLRPYQQPGIGTMAVDAGLVLMYDPECVKRWGVQYTPTFIAHETQHPMRRHPQVLQRLAPLYRSRYEAVAGTLRAKGIGSWQELGNWAGDFAINSDLEAEGWPWPPDFTPLLPKNHDLPNGLTMEEYLRALIERAEKEEQDDDERGGERGPMGEASQPGSEGEGGGDAPSEGGGEEGEESEEQEGDSEGSQDEGAPDADAGGDDDADGPDPGRGGEGDAGDSEGNGDGGSSHQPEESEGDAGGHDSNGGGAGHDAGGGAPTARPGHGRCGSCAGVAVAGEGEGGDDRPDPMTADERDLLDRRVARDVLEYKGTDGRGFAPGGWLRDWAQRQFEAPKADPYKVLARLIRGVIGKSHARVDWKLGPPSRRREALNRTKAWRGNAPLLPVLRGPVPEVFLILDTSGSMGRGKGSALEKAARECFGFVKAAGGEARVMAVDAAVQSVVKVSTVEQLMKAMKGGGGTDMAAGVRAAAKEKPKPDVFILVTDGVEPGWPSPSDMPRGTDFVTVVVNPQEYRFRNVPAHLRKQAVWVHD